MYMYMSNSRIELKEGWVKLYYKNNKIIKEYRPVRKPFIRKKHTIKKEKSLDKEFSEVIEKMRERWEAYNEEKGYEVDYDYYCDKNEYESEPEIEDEDYDMNDVLINDVYGED